MSEGATQSGARGDGKVWKQLLWGRRLGIRRSQIPASGAEAEGAEGAAVFCELALRCSVISPPTFCSLEAEAGNGQWHGTGRAGAGARQASDGAWGWHEQLRGPCGTRWFRDQTWGEASQKVSMRETPGEGREAEQPF